MYEKLFLAGVIALGGCMHAEKQDQPQVVQATPQAYPDLLNNLQAYARGERVSNQFKEMGLESALSALDKGKVSEELLDAAQQERLIVRATAPRTIELYSIITEEDIEVTVWNTRQQVKLRVVDHMAGDYPTHAHITGQTVDGVIELNRKGCYDAAQELYKEWQSMKPFLRNEHMFLEHARTLEQDTCSAFVGQYLRAQSVQKYVEPTKNASLERIARMIMDLALIHETGHILAGSPDSTKSAMNRLVYMANAEVFARLTEMSEGFEPELTLGNTLLETAQQIQQCETVDHAAATNLTRIMVDMAVRNAAILGIDMSLYNETEREEDIIVQFPMIPSIHKTGIAQTVADTVYVQKTLAAGRPFSALIDQLEENSKRTK